MLLVSRKPIALLLACALALSPGSSAFARSDEEQIAEEMAQAAGNALLHRLGDQAVKSLVDNMVYSTPPPAELTTVGQEAVSWIRLGLAGKDLVDAKNDQQRAMAGADVVVGILMMTNPAVGAVAALAVLAAKLCTAILSVGHAREMLEIAKRTQEHIAATVVIYRQQAKSDALRFISWIQRLGNEMKAIADLGQEIEKTCGEISGQSTTWEKLEKCHLLLMDIFPRARTWSYLSAQVNAFESQYVSREAIFKAVEVDEAAFRGKLAEIQATVKSTEEKAKAILKDLHHASARIAVDRAVADGNLESVLQMRNQCYSVILRFNRAANLALVRGHMRPSEENRQALAQIYAENETSIAEACRQLTPGEEDPLFQLLVIHERTRVRVADAMALED